VIDRGWHHIAGTFDGSYLKIYVDGEIKTSSDDLSEYNLTGYYDDYDKTYIGYEDDLPLVGAVYFDGTIDDVRVYNYALRKCEIWDAMSGDLPRFRIKNSADETVAWFDSFGNLVLKGKQKNWGVPSGPDDKFIIEDSSGAVAYIDESGDLYLSGELYKGAEP